MELTKRGLLLAKIETTYGTPSSPVVGSNVVAAVKSQVNLKLGGELVDRDLLDGNMHKLFAHNSLFQGSLQFRTELRGNRTTGAVADISAGASGQAVDIDPLLRACNMAATYTAESGSGARDGSVIYKPTQVNDAGPSVTFLFYSELKTYQMAGAKGTFNLVLQAGKPGYIDWDFKGLFTRPDDGGIPGAATWLATKAPLFERQAIPSPYWLGTAVTLTNATDVVNCSGHGLFNGDRVRFAGSVPAELTVGTWYYVVQRALNTFKVALTRGGSPINFTTDGSGITMDGTPSLIYDGWAPSSSASGPVFNQFSISLGNAVIDRLDAQSEFGRRGFAIGGRNTAGSFNPESVAAATHPFWTDFMNTRIKPFTIGLGKDTGNRIVIEGKQVIQDINYADENEKRIQSVTFAHSAEIGDAYGSDFSIEFK